MCMNYICMDTDVIYTLDYAFYILLFFSLLAAERELCLKIRLLFLQHETTIIFY